MRNLLAPLRQRYDFILIDCSPSLGLVTLNALVAADSVLIPVQCGCLFALEVSASCSRHSMPPSTQSKLNPQLQIEGFLLTMYDARLRLANQVAGEVREHFGDLAFQTIIQRDTRLSEAPSFGKPALLYDASSSGGVNCPESGQRIHQEEKPKKITEPHHERENRRLAAVVWAQFLK